MHTTPRPSLVSELAETLRRDLHAGEWRDFLPSERALCERLQISRPTLRKALTILSREGWLRAEHGLGWRIGQPPAASPVLRESRSVGLVCFVPLNEASSFSLFTIETLQEHLHRAGFDAHVHAGTQYASQNYRQALERLVRMDPSRGWVLIGGSRRIERWFVERKIPCFVTLTFRSATLQSPALTVDFDAVHRHAAPLLYERGHRRIALVFPRAIAGATSGAGQHRRHEEAALFQRALGPYQACPGMSAAITFHSRSPESVEAAVRARMQSSSPPTAFVVLRPQHALSVLTALTNSGFRVPGAASLISIGHEPFLDHARPSVAHYKIERPFCGRTLSRMILSWVRTGHCSPERQAIRMRFQDGQSLGAVR